MTKFEKEERRRHERYDTDLKIAFSVNFELETKIQFQLKDDKKDAEHIYTATGHNINVEGLGFLSNKELTKGDQLAMDVFLPAAKTPIGMEGHVMWCRAVNGNEGHEGQYRVGVRISKVRGEDVEKTIFLDSIHKVQWSIVLESVFGGFKESLLKIEKKEK